MDTMDSMSLGMFYIHGLFNQYNIQFDLSKRCNVFIGENGIGKTTILKMLDTLFEGNIAGLILYPFEKIVVVRTSKINKVETTIHYSDLFPEFDLVYIKTKERFMPEIPHEVLTKLGIVEADLKGKILEEFMEHSEVSWKIRDEVEFSTNALEFLIQLKKGGLLHKYYTNIYYENKQTSSIAHLQKNLLIGNWSDSTSDLIEIFDKHIRRLLDEHLSFNKKLLELIRRIITVYNIINYKKNYYINMVSDFKIDSETVTWSSVSSLTVSWIKQSLSLDSSAPDDIQARLYPGSGLLAPSLENAIGESAYELLKKMCLTTCDFRLDDINQDMNTKYKGVEKKDSAIQNHIFDYIEDATRTYVVPTNLVGNRLSDLKAGYIFEVLNQKIFPVNRMINRIYFEDKFVIDFNKRALKICSVFLGVHWDDKKNDEIFIKEFDKALSKKIRKKLYAIEEPSEFLSNSDVEADIREYIRPILSKDSIFLERKYGRTSEYALIALYLDQIDNLKNENNRSVKLKKIVKLLNKYINNKIVVVKPNGMTFKKYKILSEEENSGSLSSGISKEIGIDMLSSGETKLLLIFTLAIYLDYRSDFICNYKISETEDKDHEYPIYILLDEPELSLSIIWQESLLPDLLRETNNIKFIVATHSPYIIADEAMKKNIVFLPTEVIIKGDE